MFSFNVKSLKFFSFLLCTGALYACGGSSNESTPEPEVVNKSPVAKITAPAQVFAGQSVTLSCEGSSDIDGEIKSYSWRLIQGQAQLHNANQCDAKLITSHNQSVNYQLELTVADDKQATGVANHSLISELYVGKKLASNTHHWQAKAVGRSLGSLKGYVQYRDRLIVAGENRIVEYRKEVSEIESIAEISPPFDTKVKFISMDANLLYVLLDLEQDNLWVYALDESGGYNDWRLLHRYTVESGNSSGMLVKNEMLYLSFIGSAFDQTILQRGSLYIYDLKDKETAKEVTRLDGKHELGLASGIALYQNQYLMLNTGSGISLYSLENPAEPKQVSYIGDTAPGFLGRYELVGNTAYLFYDADPNTAQSEQVRLFDISDLKAPALKAKWQSPIMYSMHGSNGRLFAYNGDSFLEFDVSALLTPKAKSYYNLVVPADSFIWNNYLVSLNASKVDNYFYGGVRFFDLSLMQSWPQSVPNLLDNLFYEPRLYQAVAHQDKLLLSSGNEEIAPPGLERGLIKTNQLSLFSTAEDMSQLLTTESVTENISGLNSHYYTVPCEPALHLSLMQDEHVYLSQYTASGGHLFSQSLEQSASQVALEPVLALESTSVDANVFKQHGDNLLAMTVSGCNKRFKGTDIYQRQSGKWTLGKSITGAEYQGVYIGASRQKLYIAQDRVLKVWSYSAFDNLELDASFELTNNILSGVVDNGNAYLLLENGKLAVLDISTPAIALQATMELVDILPDRSLLGPANQFEPGYKFGEWYPVIGAGKLYLLHNSRNYALLFDRENSNVPVYQGYLFAPSLSDIIFEGKQPYLAYTPDGQSAPELIKYDFIQPELAGIGFSASRSQQIELPVSWSGAVQMSFECQVTAGECEVLELDNANQKAQVRWSLPAESGDYELTLFNKTHRQLGVQKRQIRVM